jgi:peptidoglycan/LPS O-acetylase OafA/YrhL
VLFLVNSVYLEIELNVWDYALFFANNESYTYSQRSPLTHFWSICVEMQFYLLLPFLLRYKRTTINVIASCFVVIAIYSRWLVASNIPYPAVWNFTSSHLDAFAIGIFLAVNMDYLKKLTRNRTVLTLIIYFNFLVLGLSCGFNSETVFTSTYSAFTYFFASITFGLLVFIANLSDWKFKGVRLLTWFGLRSYGLYVVHFPIIYFVLTWTNNRYLDAYELVFIILITLIVAEVSFKFFETPFLRMRMKFQKFNMR